MGLDFNCTKCGKCCHEIENKVPGFYKRIPLYPEEADRLEEIAKKSHVPLKMIEDLVFPDIKNKKILVVTWRIILEPEGVCPFYLDKGGCSIHEKKPLACLAYPLALKRVDAFNTKIDIDPLCKFTLDNRGKLEKISFKELQKIYKSELKWAREMLKRNQRAIMEIKTLEHRKRIEIPRNIEPDKYNDYLKNWDRKVIK